MPSARSVIIASFLGTLVACGGAPAPAPAASTTATAAPHRGAYTAWLHVTAPGPNGSLRLVDAHGSVLRELDGGLLAPDGIHLYSVSREGPASRLDALDARTGVELWRRVLPGTYSIPAVGLMHLAEGLSPGGRFLVLQGGVQNTAGRYVTSSLLVVDTAQAGTLRRIDLPGDLRFDGVSSDGSRLFLIESIGTPGQESSYRVRWADVASGRLDPNVVVDKLDPETSMTGVPLSRVDSADGSWQLTVYAFGRHGAFVHALNLSAAFAVCMDLPAKAGTSKEVELMWSVVRSADGERSFIVNGAEGVLIPISLAGDAPPTLGVASTLVVSRPVAAVSGSRVVDAEAMRQVSAGSVLSADGRHLYVLGDRGILAVDTATMRMSVLVPELSLVALALSGDGQRLVAIEAGGIHVHSIDTARGARVPFVSLTGGRIDAVVRVDAAGR